MSQAVSVPQPKLRQVRIRLSFCSRAEVADWFAEPLTTSTSYAERFADHRPWPHRTGQEFWRRYMGGRQPGDISGLVAWREMVPLRFGDPLPTSLQVSGEGLVRSEVFVHPWGASCLVTVDVQQPEWELDELADLLVNLYSEDWLAVDGKALSLFDAADRLLGKGVEGLGAPLGPPVADPFTVFAVLSGKGGNEAISPEAESVRRLLHAALTFRGKWREDTLPKNSDVRVAGLPVSPPSHLVVGRARSRAIWSPSDFAKPGHTIGCYHRNMTLLCMQIDSMLVAASGFARALESGTSLNNEQRKLMKRLAGHLGRLFDGDRSTYRSGSATKQISIALDDCNRLRQEYGMPGLKAQDT
jgi:hypothetical protein